MRLLVTGGCGFIGSNFIRHVLAHYGTAMITNVDALTYAGNLANLDGIPEKCGERYEFFHADIADTAKMNALMEKHQFFAVVNFAAESHVDRSISGPQAFIHSNVLGTAVMLDCARRHGVRRFLQVSTDEVYGSLGPEGRFTELSPIVPSSPYSVSKASADLLALAHHHTYGQEVVITRCSNNYGPYQYPEKLIPLMISHALHGKPLPVYGDGSNVRDWLYVADHCAAIRTVLRHGRVGEVYNIGGDAEMSNLQLVRTLCMLLDEMHPRPDGLSYAEQIRFVTDRPGHDRRYAINALKLRHELGWQPEESFASGIRKTIAWYLEHQDWAGRLEQRRGLGSRAGAGLPKPGAFEA